ncbi:MAG: DNA polymerase I, partial [Elusimicrobiota bacterium]|nr:DNA polymerase I [Elusimicrobiota bacterium]
MKKKKIILIDGNSYMHRAYHALPRLTDESGNLVNAIFGFMKMLNKVIKEERPEYICVAFDHKGPTFRHKEYKEYKSHRKKTDSELIDQFPKAGALLDALNIEHLAIEGFEADDTIASLAREASDRDIGVTIVTGDKDALQLVNDNIIVLNGMKDITYDIKTVKEKYSINPEQIVDYLALIGDKSDNLPGVRGIGPVTAKKLLKEYESVEGIYKNLESIKENIREKLVEHKEECILTKRMVELVENMELPVGLEDCLWKGPDPEKIAEELKKLNFMSLISDWMETDNLREEISCEVVDDIGGLKKYLDGALETGIMKVEVLFRDCPSDRAENLIGLGFYSKGSSSVYVPVSHRYLGASNQLRWEEIKELFSSEPYCSKIKIGGYDLKRIYRFFKGEGIKFEKLEFDAVTADYILTSKTGIKSLKNISSRYLGWAPADLPEEAFQKEISEIAGIVSGRLAVVENLRKTMLSQMKEAGQYELFTDIEMPLVKILAEMELTGIMIDTDELEDSEKAFNKKLDSLSKEIFKLAGRQFNIDSPKQLSEILFTKLGLEPIKKTKTGYSTSAGVLKKLVSEHPIPEKIIEYRKLRKLVSTYIEPIKELTDKKSSRLHTTFNITGTQTGRLSSSDPNLQNIPVKSEEGILIRKAFIASPGKVFISADYSQIDLRVLAHICGDKNLVESFKNNEDIHTRTAAKINGIKQDEVTGKLRKNAKAINFGIVYGMSSWGLSKRIDMSKKEAKDFIDKYFKEFPGVKEYMDNIVSEAKEKGYVETIFNRKRYLPEINSSSHMRRQMSERMAINTPIQGSSADIIKVAMVELDEKYSFNQKELKMLLQIHDELIFEVPEENVESIQADIKSVMETSVELNVPVKVDF